jgi:hypothetical protein
MIGIVIATFNRYDLFRLQMEHIKKFCIDDHIIQIVDNSTLEESCTKIKEYCAENGIRYYRPEKKLSDKPSMSHGMALNIGWNHIYNLVDILLFLDHDIFPFREFSVTKALGEKMMWGQYAGEWLYWPGLFAVSSKIDFLKLNMEPPGNGYDTGGFTKNLVESIGKDNCIFLRQEGLSDDRLAEFGYYSFYSIIGDWMHFHNSSEWEKIEGGNEKRILILADILSERTQNNNK